MSGVLIVAEHVQGVLRPVTLEAVAAAQLLGGPVVVAVVAAEPASLAAAVDVAGVDSIVCVRTPTQEFDSDTYRTVTSALIEQLAPNVVLMGFTSNAMSYGPAVAAVGNLGFASDVFGLSREGGELVATRSMYGGKVHAEIDFPGRTQVMILLRPGAFTAPAARGAADIRELAIDSGAARVRHLAFTDALRSDVDITKADLLVSVGRGLGDQESLNDIESLAIRLGGLLSVSRPLVDAGWVAADRQVGQSGRTVAPKVYLALGISGAVQHLAGMSTSGTIIAVNTDHDAPIFGIAHYGATCDLHDVVEALDALVP